MTKYFLLFSFFITSSESFASPGGLNLAFLLQSKIEDGDESLFQEIFDSGDAINDKSNLSSDESIPSDDRIDEMLNKILADSIEKVESTLPGDLQSGGLNLMEDEEFKEEVGEIFDKASIDLKSALEEIRKEQESFAKDSSAKSAARVELAMKEDQARLERAQASMSKIIEKVNRERAEVEKAVKELEDAQRNSSNDVLTTFASGGIIKQGALTGTILFTVRSALEMFYVLGGESSHAIPALIQGALALAFAAYFFFA
mmetsp:Transcript_25286/g.38350  ORF Transcript_25286/g.38350 Transcript_25286/m.38350 type:complete len:258 (-) Transcript_25286:275-1048(-)